MLYMQYAEKFPDSPGHALAQGRTGTQDSTSMKDKMSDLDLMLAGIPRAAMRFVEKTTGIAPKKGDGKERARDGGWTGRQAEAVSGSAR